MPRQTARTIATAAAATAIATGAPAIASQSTEAKNYIAAPTGAQHTDDVEVGELPERVMKSAGKASESLVREGVQMIADTPMDQDWLDNMAFMNEKIEIQIGETEDQNAEQIFEININGRAFVFRRGENKIVPRYVADHMLRMKRTGYTQKEVHNTEGVKDIVWNPRTSLKYPLMVVRDASPHARAWFQFTTALRG